MMLRILACVLLVHASAQGQGLPYGVPPPLAARAGIPAPIAPYNQNLYPFGPAVPPYPVTAVRGIPGNPGVPGVVPPGVIPPPGVRNPYYNAPVGPAVPILTYSSVGPNLDGSYEFSFSTADGKQVQEAGYLKDAYIDNNGEPQGTQVVTGSYAYIAPDGTPIQVSYVADENGFRPSGVHIPANGRGAVPDLFSGNYTRGAFDPAYRYNNNPYSYRNQYNNNPYSNQYNSALRYDPARYDTYSNGYRPNWYNNPKKDSAETSKKD